MSNPVARKMRAARRRFCDERRSRIMRSIASNSDCDFIWTDDVATPNDPKLSDRGGAARHLPHGWNGGQMTELRRAVGRRVAGAVTRRSGSLQRMVRPRLDLENVCRNVILEGLWRRVMPTIFLCRGGRRATNRHLRPASSKTRVRGRPGRRQ